MAKSRKTRAPAARRSKRSKRSKASDRMVELSIAAGDPLQPGGLAEYLSMAARPKESKAGSKPKPAPAAAAVRQTEAQKAERDTALKAAQARWSSRQTRK